MTLASLAATLRLYRDPEVAGEAIPLLRLLGTSAENLKNRAERLAPRIAEMPAIATAEIVADHAYLGGGSVPSQQLPTWCIALTPNERSVDELAGELRTADRAIFGRIQQDRLLLDLRAVFPQEDMIILETLQSLPGKPALPNEGEATEAPASLSEETPA